MECHRAHPQSQDPTRSAMRVGISGGRRAPGEQESSRWCSLGDLTSHRVPDFRKALPLVDEHGPRRFGCESRVGLHQRPLGRIVQQCEFTALRYFTLDGSDYPSHAAQEAAIAGYLRRHNRHTTPKRHFAMNSKIRKPDYLPNVA